MQTFKRFFYSPIYLALVSFLTLIIWTFQLEQFLAVVMLLVLFLQFAFLEDAMPTVAIIFNALFMIGNGYQNWTMETIPLYIYLTPFALILGIVVHYIRFQTKFFQGKMMIGILIMFAAALLSTINAEFVNLNYVFYLVVGMMYGLIYFIYVGSFKQDHRQYLLTMFLFMGLVVSAEVLIYYLRVDDIALAITNKTIHLGWGVSNYVATYLIMFIPVSFYFAKKSKLFFLWILLIAFQMSALAFTLSRAGIIAFLLILPLLLLYLLYEKKIWKTVVNFSLLVGFMAGIYFLNQTYFNLFWERMMDRGLDDTGRIEIWEASIEMFLRYPLFGGGVFAKYDTMYRMYHNTFLHVLATMGILGFMGLIHQLYTQFRVLLHRFSYDRIILVIAMLGVHAHGMVDNIYLMPQFMIILVVIVAVYERANLSPNPQFEQVR